MRRRRFLALAAAFACTPRGARAGTWQGRALGAEVSVTLHGPRAEVDAALAEVPALLDRIERTFSLYDPNSELSRLNRTGRLPSPSPWMRALVAEADAAHRLTGGLFDPTVQPLWRALAERGDAAAARRHVGWQRVRRADCIRLEAGQALTFNGIAQGFATDTVRDRLAERGFTRALIDIGEQAALGGPWRLGLVDPDGGPLGQRTLHGGAIATSSPGALRLRPGDRDGDDGHILAPDGRAPLWSTLSVEASRATRADALSTAAVFLDRAALARLRTRARLARITAVDAAGDLSTL
ncbi:Thiamine biosynthesis lipoprotein ApbE precursor [Roseivivax jejudonensis]|uniref:FAD:protein FMN transferase n=1 Tax=Roseivivax jejudonensis TaxID=1529041 RepID=A0A1X6YC41_9RHOB|nr:FAD:protein FMN transferase [Roseivivax jejudonensis]SLN16140.1 Thiamine biosynthesis lipoprotein ApbE precursor [Roseivivax jejudonensis]